MYIYIYIYLNIGTLYFFLWKKFGTKGEDFFEIVFKTTTGVWFEREQKNPSNMHKCHSPSQLIKESHGERILDNWT